MGGKACCARVPWATRAERHRPRWVSSVDPPGCSLELAPAPLSPLTGQVLALSAFLLACRSTPILHNSLSRGWSLFAACVVWVPPLCAAALAVARSSLVLLPGWTFFQTGIATLLLGCPSTSSLPTTFGLQARRPQPWSSSEGERRAASLVLGHRTIPSFLGMA